ncbi:MAG: adenylate/guanylate cyclase domain-containing protein, partial [Hyphomicrobium sp.]|uniref:adenylate/guanylate cyclase domain-containing protein n=1 Tax=Hyphomicrobium sp. TaxID=82 RepID=UPI003D0F3F33
KEDDARRAVACAIEMQLAMAQVNEGNRENDLPELQMGIGIHTGQVVVGNIGSVERMKYGVVGSHVNLTSRIQSFTTGGQILCSEATRREVGPMLRLGKQMEVRAKGFEQPITLSEVVALGGPYKLALYQVKDDLTQLADELAFTYRLVEGDHLNGQAFKGRLVRLSLRRGEARLEASVPMLTNLEIRLIDDNGKFIPGTLYAKTAGPGGESGTTTIQFSSMPPEIETLLRDAVLKIPKTSTNPVVALPADIEATVPPDHAVH